MYHHSSDIEFTLVLDVVVDESKAQLRIPECQSLDLFHPLKKLATEYRCRAYTGNYYPSLSVDLHVFPYGLVLVGLSLPEAELATFRTEVVQDKGQLMGLLEEVREHLRAYCDWDERSWSLPGADLQGLLGSFDIYGPPMGLTGGVIFKPPSVSLYLTPADLVSAFESFAAQLKPHLRELEGEGTDIQRDMKASLMLLRSGLLGRSPPRKTQGGSSRGDSNTR